MLDVHTANEEQPEEGTCVIISWILSQGATLGLKKKSAYICFCLQMSPSSLGVQRPKDSWLLREFPGMFQRGMENTLSQFQSEK